MEASIVISRKGHDTGRAYVVAGSAGGDFLLLVDGEYRKLDNPKCKRAKHVKYAGKTTLDLTTATDADVRKALAAAKQI